MNHRYGCDFPDYKLAWLAPGYGKFYKRKLHKAQRQYIKLWLMGKQPKDKRIVKYGSLCNDKDR